MKRTFASPVILATLLFASCQGGDSASPTSPSRLVGVSAGLQSFSTGGSTTGAGGAGLVGDAQVVVNGTETLTKRGVSGSALASLDVRAVDFPPRDQSFLFRQELETIYRDVLQRIAGESFVDNEGSVVWIQEYLRYRVNGCGHADAVSKVLSQIRGGGIAPVCSATTTTNFPPRNEPFDFRNDLEALYRDELLRTPTTTFVDIEGDLVWIQEYLRYWVIGCSHLEATNLVRDQIQGGSAQAPCVDGEWSGTTSQGLSLSMTVLNNQITRISVPVRASLGSCSQIIIVGAVGAETITNGTFAFAVNYADGSVFTMAGVFTSQNSATGSVAYEERGAAPFCTGASAILSWEMAK